MCVFFFFKQKTAYEMRISDWSSDVCSSDLGGLLIYDLNFIDIIKSLLLRLKRAFELAPSDLSIRMIGLITEIWKQYFLEASITDDAEIGRASCRERVCQYV